MNFILIHFSILFYFFFLIIY